ncbi:MAG TPA: peptide chain release factor N(5)-glutamine methyltransferase [Natronosporangium sp.]|nr:peptide chain release factor N(5)-glutamine methyltransferase [Natronosporangium sp.]
MGRKSGTALVAEAARVLAAAGVASPRVDAELLAAHVLGVSRAQLVLMPDWDDAAKRRYRQLVAARAQRVPLQHLTGTAGFGHLELAVGPGVFVPRPETELLADWASRLVATLPGDPVVVDLASGSGALALEIAHRCPAARVVAVERSEAALVWLRRNAAARAAAGDRPVTVVAADATDPAALGDLVGQVAVVVCNPPYVPEGTPVPPEVADHDPPEAVFAGPDGLAVIRPVVACAATLLRPGGWFGMEHDDTHGEVVPALLRGRFTEVTDHPDLAGRPRYVTGRRVDTA